MAESKDNFEKKGALFSSHGTPYDYDSIMHYEDTAFSATGKKTILPLLPNITIRYQAKIIFMLYSMHDIGSRFRSRV